MRTRIAHEATIQALIGAVLVGGGLVISSHVQADPTLSGPTIKTLVIEASIPYTVRKYEPPYRLQVKDVEKKQSVSSPENAVSAYIVGILHRDVALLKHVVEGPCGAYTLGSQNAAQSRAELSGTTRLFKHMFANRPIVITHRVDIGEQVMLYVVTGTEPSKSSPSQWPFFVDKFSGKWKVTESKYPDAFSAFANYFPINEDTLTFKTLLASSGLAARECSGKDQPDGGS